MAPAGLAEDLRRRVGGCTGGNTPLFFNQSIKLDLVSIVRSESELTGALRAGMRRFGAGASDTLREGLRTCFEGTVGGMEKDFLGC